MGARLPLMTKCPRAPLLQAGIISCHEASRTTLRQREVLRTTRSQLPHFHLGPQEAECTPSWHPPFQGKAARTTRGPFYRAQ